MTGSLINNPVTDYFSVYSYLKAPFKDVKELLLFMQTSRNLLWIPKLVRILVLLKKEHRSVQRKPPEVANAEEISKCQVMPI